LVEDRSGLTGPRACGSRCSRRFADDVDEAIVYLDFVAVVSEEEMAAL
jgi:hypothetical protein